MVGKSKKESSLCVRGSSQGQHLKDSPPAENFNWPDVETLDIQTSCYELILLLTYKELEVSSGEDILNITPQQVSSSLKIFLLFSQTFH